MISICVNDKVLRVPAHTLDKASSKDKEDFDLPGENNRVINNNK